MCRDEYKTMAVEEQLPEGVRAIPPAPHTRWEIRTTSGFQWDGYVFEDDPSDLAKFIRWLSSSDFTRHGEPLYMRLQNIVGP
jgi:hypothetical protein